MTQKLLVRFRKAYRPGWLLQHFRSQRHLPYSKTSEGGKLGADFPCYKHRDNKEQLSFFFSFSSFSPICGNMTDSEILGQRFYLKFYLKTRIKYDVNYKEKLKQRCSGFLSKRLPSWFYVY
jgi:hypothetical protein